MNYGLSVDEGSLFFSFLKKLPATQTKEKSILVIMFLI